MASDDDHAHHDDMPHYYHTDIIEYAGVRYTLATLQAIFIVMAVVGNCGVIYIIVKRGKIKKSATASLILNLAICDVLSSGFHQPMRLVLMLLPFEDPTTHLNLLGNTYCKINGFNRLLISSTGFLTVVAIALERYLLICHPLKAKSWLTFVHVRVVIGCLWLVAFVTSLPLPIKFTYVAHAHFRDANITICLQDIFSEKTAGPTEYYSVIFLLYFGLPIVLISVCYTRIFYVLYSGTFSVEVHNDVSRRVVEARKRLAKLMLCIAVLFSALHGPYFVTFLMIAAGLGIPSNPVFTLIVLETLPLVNAVINPFIYSAHSRSFFKKKMMSVFGGQYEDSTAYRRESGSNSVRLISKQSSLVADRNRKSSADAASLRTDSTSVRTDSWRTQPGSRGNSFRVGGPLNRNESQRTYTGSERSDSFNMYDMSSQRYDDVTDAGNERVGPALEDNRYLTGIKEESESR